MFALRKSTVKILLLVAVCVPALAACTQNLLNLQPNARVTTPTQKPLSTAPGEPLVFEAEITGREVSDIIFDAKRGDRIQVNMKSPSSLVYFDVYPPGDGKVLFVGQADAEPTEWVGTALVDGNYMIRVYQLGGARTLNTKASYTVTLRKGEPV